jgi:hypothetical protein
MKIDQQELRDYLLGRLPEELATALDTSLFADTELHRELQDERDSLIEDFVYDRLTSEEEQAFQAQCVLSPLLEEKVNSFRVFLSALERQSDQARLMMAPFLPRFFILISPVLAFMLCIAAFLYVREFRRNALLNSQLLALSHGPVPVGQTGDDKHPTVVAFLSANVPRDASVPPEIIIPATAALLELQVEVHSPSLGDADWDAELLRGTEVVWRSSHLPLHRVGQEAVLSLLLNTESVRAGSYTIQYSLRSDPGSITTRPFRIVN